MVRLLDAITYGAIETGFIEIPKLESVDSNALKICSGRDSSDEHTKMKARVFVLFKNRGYGKKIHPE